ncbi:hypothetical protein SAMN05443634_110137 [Chishuiella changwenlii]|uniref:Uncharacterized protein n=1 Tax=Chishuiella changwenlii TaxID=1434701 RepID=A0A1M7BDQ4_9FLAO|nr:hypothetical protein [Chishuiella changwenlii]GGE96558.1 hypothetical protein GCM10010984_12610 [Chishuiella changwenlii]SHL52986.1 hypothetical protein SAMN05443634_110137 [Chishuiella changwenlii]
MIFFYTQYEHILGRKFITGTLKKENQPQQFELYIITPGTKFLGLPMGGGLVKLSRLYTMNGELIHARNYSPEIKNEVKKLKKTLKIPYFKLWKGYLIILAIVSVAAVIFAINNKIKANKYNDQTTHLNEALNNLKAGQLYGATFFTDAEGNSINGLPQGWIKIEKIEGDTIFVKRSLKTETDKALFEMENISKFKPTTENEWNSHVEKINYPLLKKGLQEKDNDRFDLLYIGKDNEKYSGVTISLKGAE